MSRLYAELRRRNVLRVGAAYLVFAWLVLQVVGLVGPILGLPEWVARATLLLLAVGLVAAIVLSWVYELTPQGIERTAAVPVESSVTAETGRRLDRLTIAGLAIAIAVVAADRWWPASEAPSPPIAATVPAAAPDAPATAGAGTAVTAPAGGAIPAAKSIAVLPFVPLSKGDDDAYFADGLTEEVTNSLAQVPDLKVAGRTSAFYFKGKNEDVREIGK